jgi:hypothetical protein
MTRVSHNSLDPQLHCITSRHLGCPDFTTSNRKEDKGDTKTHQLNDLVSVHHSPPFL